MINKPELYKLTHTYSDNPQKRHWSSIIYCKLWTNLMRCSLIPVFLLLTFLFNMNLFAVWNVFEGKYLLKINKKDSSTMLMDAVLVSLLLTFNRFLLARVSKVKDKLRRHLLVQSQKWKHQNNVWNLLKVSNKTTRMTSLTSFWFLYC